MTSEITDQLFSNCVRKYVTLFLGQFMFAQDRPKAGQHETTEPSRLIIFGICNMIRITDVENYASVTNVRVLFLVKFVGCVSNR